MPHTTSETSRDNGWIELPAALLSESGTLRLREPAYANRAEILERLRSGAYGKPFVIDDGDARRLHFSLDFVQSEMAISEPDALRFAYTRKMMAFLLFNPKPRDIVIVGLGGGSLTKYCYRHLPRARITTIEIDSDVIALGRLFAVPEPDARMRILHADAADYFATNDDLADVVLIDGCDKHGIAPTLCEERFYRNLHDRLQPHGLLVMNMIGQARMRQMHLEHLAAVFDDRLIVQKVSTGGNRIVYAFRDRLHTPDWSRVQRTAKQLQRLHGLDFATFARKLRHSCRFARALRAPCAELTG